MRAAALTFALLALAPSSVHAQDMRAACNQTRQQVQSGRVTCDQIRSNRASLQAALGRSRDNERQTSGAESFQRLHTARSTAISAGIACYDSILASSCGGVFGRDPQAERAAIRQLEQQQRLLEMQMAEIQRQVESQLETARVLTEYVEEHMPWLLSDEERQQLVRAGSHIRRVGSAFDAHSRERDEEIEELQRRFGVSLPPGTRLEQSGSGYTVRDRDGNVLFRLVPGENGYELVPTQAVLSDQEALVIGELARRDPEAALRAQLVSGEEQSDPAQSVRARMLDDLERRTMGNAPIDGSHLERVIDLDDSTPPSGAAVPEPEGAEVIDFNSGERAPPPAEPEPEGAEVIDFNSGERAPPPAEPEPEGAEVIDFNSGEQLPLPAGQETEGAEVIDFDEIDLGGNDEVTLNEPLPESELLDPTIAPDPTGPTDSPDRYPREIDWDRPDPHDPTLPREPGAPPDDPDSYPSVVDFPGARSEGGAHDESATGASSAETSGATMEPSTAPSTEPGHETGAAHAPTSGSAEGERSEHLDHERGVQLGAEPPARDVPRAETRPNPRVVQAIEQLHDDDQAERTNAREGIGQRAREALGWARERLHRTTDRIVRTVTPVVENARDAVRVGIDGARVLLPGGQHEWMADTVMWRFGEVVEQEPNHERPINRVIRREVESSRGD